MLQFTFCMEIRNNVWMCEVCFTSSSGGFRLYSFFVFKNKTANSRTAVYVHVRSCLRHLLFLLFYCCCCCCWWCCFLPYVYKILFFIFRLMRYTFRHLLFLLFYCCCCCCCCCCWWCCFLLEVCKMFFFISRLTRYTDV